jgi:hypothetical protein
MTHESEKDCDIHELNEIKSHAFHHGIGKRLEQDFAAYSVSKKLRQSYTQAPST